LKIAELLDLFDSCNRFMMLTKHSDYAILAVKR